MAVKKEEVVTKAPRRTVSRKTKAVETEVKEPVETPVEEQEMAPAKDEVATEETAAGETTEADAAEEAANTEDEESKTSAEEDEDEEAETTTEVDDEEASTEEASEEIAAEEVEKVQEAAKEVFGDGSEESVIESPIIDEKIMKQTRAAEQEELAKKISKASEVSDEESLLDHRLIEAGRNVKRSIYRDDVIPLHDEIQYESTSVIRKREYLELAESYRTGKVLYGEVTGSCVYGGHLTAIVRYGSFFRILVPFEVFTKLTKEDEERIAQAKNPKQEREKKERTRIDQYISAEIDFIVKSIDEANGLAVGDRIAAMNRKKVNFFFSRNNLGEFNINEGQKAEARIVRATENYLIAELYGVECRLSAEDLARVHIPSVAAMFPVGSTAPVKITSLTRTQIKKGQYSMSLRISIKEGVEDRSRSCFDFYNVGMRVVGVVTGIESYGVFCRLEGKGGSLDALCHFSRSDFVSVPPVGSTVAIVITGKNMEKMQITGDVTRVLKYA